MSVSDVSSKRYLFKNASITAVLSPARVASGLGLDAVILATFGLGYQTDALFTALSVPLLLISVISIQGPKVLIPVFSEYFNRNAHAEAWELLRNLVTTASFVLAGISLTGAILSRVMVPVQVPGLDPRT